LGSKSAASTNGLSGRTHVEAVSSPFPRSDFGEFAAWVVFNRRNLTIFAHAETGDDLADHTAHVIWFGPSEPLNISIFR